MFPIIPANSATASFPGNDEGIFGYGSAAGGRVAITNLVSNTGVVASDQAATTGTPRTLLGACEYGGDKGIFGFGSKVAGAMYGGTNLVSNAGVVASDTAAVGTARCYIRACSYSDKGIFAFGWDNVAPDYVTSTSNLVSNTGVVASDTAGVGTARYNQAGCEYGGDKGIFGFGTTGYPSPTLNSITNLVSNTGVVSSDQAATTGTAREAPTGCGYGGDKGLFGFGKNGSGKLSITNLVSNTGVVASDQAATTGTARATPAACEYDQDKAIIGYGDGSPGASGKLSITNLVSNTGVVASDTAGVGTGREGVGACSLN